MQDDYQLRASAGLDIRASLRLMLDYSDFLRRFIRVGSYGAMSHELAIEYLGGRERAPEQILSQMCLHEVLLANEDGSRYYLSEAPKAFFEFYHGRSMGTTGEVLRAFVNQIHDVVGDIERYRYEPHVEEFVATARSILERVNVFVRDNKLMAESQIAEARINGGASEFRLEQLLKCLNVYIEPIVRIFEVNGEVSQNIRHLEDVLIAVDSVSARDLRRMISRRMGEWRIELSSASMSLRDAVAGIRKAMNQRFSSVLDLGMQTEAQDIKLYKSAFDGVLTISVAKNEAAMSDELITSVVDAFFDSPSDVDTGFVEEEDAKPEARIIQTWDSFKDRFIKENAGKRVDLLLWLRDSVGLSCYDSLDVIIDATSVALSDDSRGLRLEFTDQASKVEFEDAIVEQNIIEVMYE